MNTFNNINKSNHLVFRIHIFLACLLLPLFANAGDFPVLEDTFPTDGTILDERLSIPTDYSWPPRCGARNCVALCVTCLYDICRATGGTVEQCNLEKESCKQSCDEIDLEECPPHRPFCDFDRKRKIP